MESFSTTVKWADHQGPDIITFPDFLGDIIPKEGMILPLNMTWVRDQLPGWSLFDSNNLGIYIGGQVGKDPSKVLVAYNKNEIDTFMLNNARTDFLKKFETARGIGNSQTMTWTDLIEPGIIMLSFDKVGLYGDSHDLRGNGMLECGIHLVRIINRCFKGQVSL